MKYIEGYEGLYSIDECGRIFSHKRNKYLSLKHDNIYGYVHAGLYKDGKLKCHNVHRLVAKAFIPNPDNLPLVNHKDGKKDNNCVDNLEWCTQKENVAHCIANDLRGKAKAARAKKHGWCVK